VVAETNFGGEMVTATLKSALSDARVLKIHAKKAKALRAEPVVGLFEQERAHIVGSHRALEEQMTEWVPYVGDDSPDRLDAMVYAVTALMKGGGRAQIGNPVGLRLIRGGAA